MKNVLLSLMLLAAAALPARAETIEDFVGSWGFAVGPFKVEFGGEAFAGEFPVADAGGAVADVVAYSSRTSNEMGQFFTDALAMQAAGKNVLVIFDIDNTLLTYASDFPGSPWLSAEFGKIYGCDPKLPDDVLGRRKEALLAVAKRARAAAPHRVVPEKAAERIQALQTAGVPILVLTSRGPEEAEPTLAAMRAAGIDFSQAPLGADFEKKLKRGTKYVGGIYFTAGQHKGKMLEAILAETGHATEFVFFVDDKQKHIDRVLETLSDGGTISYHGVRYGKEDASFAAYKQNPGRARAELKAYIQTGKIIADGDAAALAAVSEAEANRLIYGVTDVCAR